MEFPKTLPSIPTEDEVTAFFPKMKTEKSERKPKKELLREARKKPSGAAAKVGTKYALTAIRHSFCQRLLEAGVDHTTVAVPMGHSDAVMVTHHRRIE